MMKYISSLIFLMPACFTSCNNYLDVVPENDIQTIETTFEKREDAYKWFTTCYGIMSGHYGIVSLNPAPWGCDEVVASDYFRNKWSTYQDAYGYGMGGLYIGDGVQMAQSPYCNIWSSTDAYLCIRYCNLFLDNIDGVYNIEDKERNYWRAMIQALKAQTYFELFRHYGPFILVPENIDAAASIDEMQQPRASVDDCVDAIVALCDEAMPNLRPSSETQTAYMTYITKEGCAAIKALTLLYAASPLFNGNDMLRSLVNRNGERLFPEYDKEKWRKAAEAAEEAIRYATTVSNRELYHGAGSMSTSMLNTIYDNMYKYQDYTYTNPEVILCVRGQDHYYWAPEYYYHPLIDSSTDTQWYDWSTYGGMGATMKMVEMYYTEHGLPLSEDKQWMSSRYAMSKESDERYKNVVALGQNVLSLHRRREPRFYADIAADGTYWVRNNTSGVKTATLVECLQGKKFGSTSKKIDVTLPQSLSGYHIKKYDNIDVQYYNYTNYNTQETGVVLIRLADLYLAAAEAWNEYLSAPDDEHVYQYIDLVRDRAGILGVKDAWKTYARNPQKCETRAGMREIIQQEWNIEFAFEGRRFWNCRRWLTAQTEFNEPLYGWNITESDPARFYNNYREPVVVWKKRSFTAPRDYFFPIPSEEILISGCKQNLGW